jgi:Transcriptional regulatory protein, C terminal
MRRIRDIDAMERPILILVDLHDADSIHNITCLLRNSDTNITNGSEQQDANGDSGQWLPLDLRLDRASNGDLVSIFADAASITLAVLDQEQKLKTIGTIKSGRSDFRHAETDPSDHASLFFDRAGFRVRRGSQWLRLNPTDFELLEYFAANPDRVISRSELIGALSTPDKHIQDRTVDVWIKRLRVALGDHGNEGLIRTHRNAGYYYSDPAKA